MLPQTTQPHTPAGKEMSQLPEQPAAGRRIPSWGWWVIAGAASLVLAATVSYLFRPSTQSFTLIVRNVPQGSAVYVDNLWRGIPGKQGEIRIPYLRPSSHQVRLSEKDNQTVPYQQRPEQEYYYNAPAVDETPKENNPVVGNLPEEIEYGYSKMVLIEGGPFLMGDNSQDNAKPERMVPVDSFYIDKFEVSNRLYQRFCVEPNCQPPVIVFDPRYFRNQLDSPVIGVSYEDAAAYAERAGKRLPTEAEWEKAASWDPDQNQKRKWPWGEDAGRGNVNLGSQGGLRVLPVGKSKEDVSAYGVMDLVGNAQEWVDALYDPYEGNQSPDRLSGRGFRVVRGGDWQSRFDEDHTTKRSPEPRGLGNADKKTWAITFRCAVSVADPRLQAFLRVQRATR